MFDQVEKDTFTVSWQTSNRLNTKNHSHSHKKYTFKIMSQLKKRGKVYRKTREKNKSNRLNLGVVR